MVLSNVLWLSGSDLAGLNLERGQERECLHFCPVIRSGITGDFTKKKSFLMKLDQSIIGKIQFPGDVSDTLLNVLHDKHV